MFFCLQSHFNAFKGNRSSVGTDPVVWRLMLMCSKPSPPSGKGWRPCRGTTAVPTWMAGTRDAATARAAIASTEGVCGTHTPSNPASAACRTAPVTSATVLSPDPAQAEIYKLATPVARKFEIAPAK